MFAPTTSPEDQILQSRRVLAAWDWMSTISTRPQEVVRLLQGEARALEGLAMTHPENAPAALQLIAAYKRLANSVQKRQHNRDDEHRRRA